VWNTASRKTRPTGHRELIICHRYRGSLSGRTENLDTPVTSRPSVRAVEVIGKDDLPLREIDHGHGIADCHQHSIVDRDSEGVWRSLCAKVVCKDEEVDQVDLAIQIEIANDGVHSNGSGQSDQ